jgi:hypothetical protein
MGRLVVFVILIGVIVLVLRSLKPRTRAAPRTPTYPYRKRKSLFSPAERSLLGVLDREVAGRYRVFGKVRLADVLAVDSGVSSGDRQAAHNSIRQKHVDFVLCTLSDLTIVAVIELDDKSHQRPDRQARDAFLAAACSAAGLKLIRFPVKSAYSASEVNEALGELGQSPGGALRLPGQGS